jgi:hypothetical protein
MRIESLARWMSPVLATVLGCGLFEPRDVPASVTWLEARFAGSQLHLRVVGSVGCGHLKDVRVQVNPGAVVVFARATPAPADLRCGGPVTYDTTVSVPIPGSSAGISFSVSQTGSPANAVEFFGTSLALGVSVEALVGGTAVVEGAGEGCPRIRVDPGGAPSEIVYPIEFSRDIEMRDGDRLFLAGVLPEAVSSFCYGGPVIWVKRVTLSLARAAA